MVGGGDRVPLPCMQQYGIGDSDMDSNLSKIHVSASGVYQLCDCFFVALVLQQLNFFVYGPLSCGLALLLVILHSGLVTLSISQGATASLPFFALG